MANENNEKITLVKQEVIAYNKGIPSFWDKEKQRKVSNTMVEKTFLKKLTWSNGSETFKEDIVLFDGTTLENPLKKKREKSE